MNVPLYIHACHRDIGEVFGFQDGAPGLASDKPSSFSQAACDLDAFLDDDMFNSLFDASELERMLDPGSSETPWDQSTNNDTPLNTATECPAPYQSVYKTNSLASRVSCADVDELVSCPCLRAVL